MKKHAILRTSLRIVSVATLCAIAAPVSADGLQGQFKTRMPIAPGAVQELSRTQRKSGQMTPIVSTPVSDQEIISIIVRRNLRANQRREKWFGIESKVTPEAKEAKTSPVHSGNRVDKERILRRGLQSLPAKCMKLHTHDRAVCLYESQLQKMVRLEVTVR